MDVGGGEGGALVAIWGNNDLAPESFVLRNARLVQALKKSLYELWKKLVEVFRRAGTQHAGRRS